MARCILLVEEGMVSVIRMLFLWPNHGKFWCDILFGLISNRALQNVKMYSIDDVAMVRKPSGNENTGATL